MTELTTQLRAHAAVAPAVARTFYVFEAVLMSAIVLVGFWPYYAGLAGSGTGVTRHWVVHVHGALFAGWLVVLVSQVVLVYRRRVRTHQRTGRFAAAYAVLLLLAGVAVTIVAPLAHVRNGAWPLDQAAGFLVLPIGDLLLFGSFFAAGMYCRRTPATHKRLMLLASNALIFPGAARIGDPSVGMIFGLWFLPVVLAMAFDQFTTGRIHRVYVIGVAVMLIFFARVALMTAEPWLVVGRAMLGVFL